MCTLLLFGESSLFKLQASFIFRIIAGFGKRNVRGVFGPDFGSYVMTI
jgi:hypothetical protein